MSSDELQLHALWVTLRGYLEHAPGCDFNYTDMCTCGMVPAKREFVLAMNTFIQEHPKCPDAKP